MDMMASAQLPSSSRKRGREQPEWWGQQQTEHCGDDDNDNDDDEVQDEEQAQGHERRRRRTQSSSSSSSSSSSLSSSPFSSSSSSSSLPSSSSSTPSCPAALTAAAEPEAESESGGSSPAAAAAAAAAATAAATAPSTGTAATPTRVSEPEDAGDERCVRCDIAFELDNKPRLLSCAHSMCTRCVFGSAAAERVEQVRCPRCDAPTNVRTGASCLLPEHPVIAQALLNQALSTAQPCRFCLDKAHRSKFWCANCEVPLCVGCRHAHLKFRSAEPHCVFSLQTPPPPSVATPLCPTHLGVSMSRWCSDCECAVCGYCLMESHQGHATPQDQKQRDLAVPVRNTLSDMTTRLQEQIGGVSGMIERMKDERTRLRPSVEAAKAVAVDAVENVIEALKKRQAAILAEIDKHGQEFQDKLDAKLSALSRLEHDSARVLRLGEAMQQVGSPLAFLDAAPQVTFAMERATARIDEHLTGVDSTTKAIVFRDNIPRPRKDWGQVLTSTEQIPRKDKDAATHHAYVQAQRQGCPEAAYRLAHVFYDPDTATSDLHVQPHLAMQLYESAADLGHADAAARVAALQERADEMPSEQSLRRLLRAYSHMDAKHQQKAREKLTAARVQCKRKHFQGVRVDLVHAVRCGNASACTLLGQLLFHGYGTEQQDKEGAHRLFKAVVDAASELDSADAAHLAASRQVQEEGQGQEQERREETEEHGDVRERQCAHAVALVYLGMLSEFGEGGVAMDRTAALALYQRAAAMGNAAGELQALQLNATLEAPTHVDPSRPDTLLQKKILFLPRRRTQDELEAVVNRHNHDTSYNVTFGVFLTSEDCDLCKHDFYAHDEMWGWAHGRKTTVREMKHTWARLDVPPLLI